MNQKTPEILAQTWRDRAAAQERRSLDAHRAAHKDVAYLSQALAATYRECADELCPTTKAKHEHET